jgi:hypothetical protein
MSKPKPQTVSGHALYRAEPVQLAWEKLENQIGCELPQKAREAVMAAIRQYEGSLHLRTDAQAREILRPELTELQRQLAGVLISWRKLQSSETGQKLLSDLDSEIEGAYGDRGGISLRRAVGAVERVQPLLRAMVDQGFARKWERQLSENQTNAAASVHRIAAFLRPTMTGTSSIPERNFIRGLADALAGTVPIGASSGSSTSSAPTPFQRFVFELNRQLPKALQIPRHSSTKEAFAGWIAKRLKGWRGRRTRSRTR